MANISPSDILVVQRPAGSDAGTYKTPFSDITAALHSEFMVVVADTPPLNAKEGDLYWDTGDARMFIYVTSVGNPAWVPTTPVPEGGSGSASVTVGDTPPVVAEEGDLFWDTGDARMFIYVTSVGTPAWVPTTPVPEGSLTEIDGGIYA